MVDVNTNLSDVKMVEGCSHIKKLQLASDKSFLNPRSWACVVCGFTDSVWACLLCNHVACGRTNSKHALQHFQQTKHPIAIEVNTTYVHCYFCDDYVLNDNSSGDIRLVQSLLAQVASQSYSESCSRSGRVIRPAQTCFTRCESRVEAASDHAADKRYTALCHWRYSHLARAFNQWRAYVHASKVQAGGGPSQLKRLARKRRKALTVGMTGLRNLGNTCYMNAVLQSLSHLVLLRECFRQLLPESPPPQQAKNRGSHVAFSRQTTIECFQHITTRPAGLTGRCGRYTRQDKGGLSGGEGGRRKSSKTFQKNTSSNEENPCLSVEIHALMRVMWSGKWAVVTPHAVLNAIWKHIPSFHGYTQQDAQEFLGEFLLVLQNELEQWPSVLLAPSPFSPSFLPHQLLPSLFQGHLLSKVVYSRCGHSSSMQEPFWNLSLDFPENFRDKQSAGLSLQDLLKWFTRNESLDGELYHCDTCGHDNHQKAHKQLMIAQYPDVLRLHLKRFKWSGQTQHKITTHVQFPFKLNLRPFCATPPNCVETAHQDSDILYQLSSIIMHHGQGFQSGHYTAYCWNPDAESWVHCNDARLSRTSDREVQNCQAYILFYSLMKDLNKEGLVTIEEEEEPSTKKRRTE